jgi:large subunit ribosomal protein L29
MKQVNFQELSTEELLVRVRELKEELFNLRFQLAVGQLQNPMQIRACKRDIARCKTILRQRELAQ